MHIDYFQSEKQMPVLYENSVTATKKKEISKLAESVIGEST